MATHYRGKPIEVRALDAYVKLQRCARSVQARLEAALRERGLTENQFGVLEIVLHLGPVQQHELGVKLFTSRPNVTLVVDQLEARGLVRRRRLNDRRRVQVELTPEGRRLVEREFAAHLARIMDELGALDPTEQLELARLCRKLGRRDDRPT